MIGKRLNAIALGLVMLIAQFCGIVKVYADERVDITENDVAISLSPMRENVVLNPGDEYRGSVKVVNPSAVRQDLYYKVTLVPFYVDRNYNVIYENVTGSNQITEWITIVSPTKGIIHPNETTDIEYIINVPETAPAGGQYACIMVSTDSESAKNDGININEALSISHLIFAEITGETISSGTILDAGVDSFVLGGKLRSYSTVQNTGNVHAVATYNLKINSVFGDVIYDTTSDPETHFILPDRTYYDEMVWNDTPMAGIFNVLYTVEFQGLKTEISRVVIVCPWWLMFLIILALIGLVIFVTAIIKKRKKKNSVKYVGRA